jgi:hypothetical protein
MSHHASSDEMQSEDERTNPEMPEAVQATETYQTEEGTVFYDANNPIAWLQAGSTVRLSERR